MPGLDFLSRQLSGSGTLLALLQLIVVLILAALPIYLWRSDRRRGRYKILRETLALTEIADYVCDLIVVISDALIDEVNAQDFVESFDRRQLNDAEMMLEAIAPQSLPSLALIRPLFELRTILEDGVRLAERVAEIMNDSERFGWQEARQEATRLSERAAMAAESFRAVSDEAGRGGI